MIQIALDTSVLVGLLDPKDIWHEPAIALKEALQANNAVFTIFDCVLAEAISIIARRVHEKRRESDLNQLLELILASYPAENLLWIFPDVPHLYLEVVSLVRSSGGELNFNDALIALSCRNRNIPMLATFDRDFDQVTWLQSVAEPSDLARI